MAFGKGTQVAAAVKGLGAGLTVVGTGIGIWADKQEGESDEQAWTSNLAAAGAGVATGGAVGSVIPGPGQMSAPWLDSLRLRHRRMRRRRLQTRQ